MLAAQYHVGHISGALVHASGRSVTKGSLNFRLDTNKIWTFCILHSGSGIYALISFLLICNGENIRSQRKTGITCCRSVMHCSCENLSSLLGMFEWHDEFARVKRHYQEGFEEAKAVLGVRLLTVIQGSLYVEVRENGDRFRLKIYQPNTLMAFKIRKIWNVNQLYSSLC